MDIPRHVVKRYAGERLYDTTALAYVSADTLRAAKRDRRWAVIVHDASTGEDITNEVLAPSS